MNTLKKTRSGTLTLKGLTTRLAATMSGSAAGRGGRRVDASASGTTAAPANREL